MNNASNNRLWNDELIRKHDLAGPRYTSYPTAPQFDDSYGQQAWLSAVQRSNESAAPLSLYFHIPFCDTVCYYCACNKIITANHKLAIPYVEAVKKEIDLQCAYIESSRPVHQLHWGGGTPTYLSDEQMLDLMNHTKQAFNLKQDDSGEYSIEIHPKGVTPQRLAKIRQLGFNRLSMGVQDFNGEVQKAVNRFNSKEEVEALVKAARALHFKSVSLDLIYGLPLQNTASFAETLQRILEFRPDRLSVFNYAHMPQLFKTQKQIDASLLPEPQEKLEILRQSIETLLNAGYVYVGMDHFALPDDELAKAQLQKKLHRNFQGYATYGNCDMFSFGVSSISAFGDTFFQNHKTIESYYAPLESNQLPLWRGITLSDDDKIRQAVIKELICHFELNFESIETQYGINFLSYFDKELASLKSLAEDGLVELGSNSIRVNDTGRLLIRRICMAFDVYLSTSTRDKISADNKPKYSRII